MNTNEKVERLASKLSLGTMITAVVIVLVLQDRLVVSNVLP